MKQPVRLINETENHSKYYNMDDNGDGTWTATYGRIGKTKMTYTYNMSEWHKKYFEKTSRKKGYTDVSHMLIDTGTVVRTPDNREAIVVSQGDKGRMYLTVEYENGNRKLYLSKGLSSAYVDPKLLLHKMMYPHLCQLYIQINGGSEEGQKSVNEVYNELAESQ